MNFSKPLEELGSIVDSIAIVSPPETTHTPTPPFPEPPSPLPEPPLPPLPEPPFPEPFPSPLPEPPYPPEQVPQAHNYVLKSERMK